MIDKAKTKLIYMMPNKYTMYIHDDLAVDFAFELVEKIETLEGEVEEYKRQLDEVDKRLQGQSWS